MKTLNRWIILLLSFVLITANSAWVSAAQSPGLTVEQITQELYKLAPYIKDVDINGMRQQEFNRESAVKAGFSQEVVQLAEETVAYQNELSLAAAIQGISDVTEISLPMDKYPYLQAFSSLASQQLMETGTSVPYGGEILVNACGDWDHPVPNYTPTWYNYSSANPEQTLISWGFHRTASYACEQGCTNQNGVWVDFTRGRGYSGPYGYCSSPRFRDQGRIQSSTAFRIQYGEPNPEIFSYVWPYWNWGFYVQWWHDNF